MAVVLVFGHDNLEDKPQSSESKANLIISNLVINQNGKWCMPFLSMFILKNSLSCTGLTL